MEQEDLDTGEVLNWDFDSNLGDCGYSEGHYDEHDSWWLGIYDSAGDIAIKREGDLYGIKRQCDGFFEHVQYEYRYNE